MASASAALPVVGSVVSGIAGKSSNNKAAAASSAATQQQLQMANDQVAKNTAAYAPYTNSGAAAQSMLDNYLGLGTAGGGGVSNAQSEYDAAMDALTKAQSTSAPTRGQPAGWGWNYDGNGVPTHYGVIPASSIGGGNVDLSQYQQRVDEARQRLEQSRNTPTQTDGNTGYLLRNFGNADFVKDPGYQFRLDEGTKGLERAALARGGFNSGAALKALDRYNQDYASSEFGNAYNRDASNKSRIYDMLSGGANRGVNAVSSNASASAGLISGAGTAIANNATNQGNYAIGGASAINNAVQGGIGNYLYQQRTAAPNASIVGNTDLYNGGNSKPSWMV